MEVLLLNEDSITENLSGESKKKFLDFCNAWSVVDDEGAKGYKTVDVKWALNSGNLRISKTLCAVPSHVPTMKPRD